MNTRAKWAYLSYDSMITKIADGTLDEYDIIFTKDKHEIYVISPELEPWAVRSKVYVFSSELEANTQLNINTDTYVGQIISIIKDEVCKGYIVNKNQNGVFYVEQLSPDNIDYNNIGNRPIENLVGTLDTPIVVETLDVGSYKIKGQYKVYDTEETTHLSANGDLFLVDFAESKKSIKRFTKDSIDDYVISDDGVEKKSYITDVYLEKNGYATTGYIDAKITAFEESIKSDVEAYVEQIVENVIANKVDMIINERLDVKLEEKIQEIPSEEVTRLF